MAKSTRRTFLTVSAATLAAGVSTSGEASAAERRKPSPAPELRAILREIDPKRIEATIRKLVSFGTRHTLSVQDDPVRGIGAARDWIHAELQRYAAASGGRMTVELQSFVQDAGPRIPVPTRITNVVATLRGTTTPNRTYVVSGHYDSRVTDVL